MLFSTSMCINLSESANAEENPVKFLSVDPGKSNGVCGYDARYYLIFMYTVQADDMLKFLNCFDHVETLVVESFNLYPNKAKEQSYSDMLTSRVIGRIEAWCETKKVEQVKQGANVKNTGYSWVGTKPLPKSNPANHELDAHIHFMYWAVRKGRVKAADLIKPDNLMNNGQGYYVVKK